MSIRIERELAFAGVGCPWEFQCSLPEWRTEQILAEPLMELGGVVERGVAAPSGEERGDGALAAGVRVRCGLPRDGSNLVAAPEGSVLLAPATRRALDHLRGRPRRRRGRARGERHTARGGGRGDRAAGRRGHRRGGRWVGGTLPHAPPRALAPGTGTTLPARRRRPPVEPVRRRGPELWAPRRPRHRLEARALAGRPRPPGAARDLRTGAPRRRRSRARGIKNLST